MGMNVDFICPACGLKGHVSGGDDYGMIAATTTIYCVPCDNLQDAEVEENVLAEPPVRTEPHCAKHKHHRIKLWNRDEPCPRCGKALLQVDEQGEVTMWD